jgi:hypothetical protein
VISVRATVQGDAGKMLQALARELGPAGRAKLNEAATHPVAVQIRGHILEASQTRHSTADNIRRGPATRTGHLLKAAESVSETVTADAGEVTISSPGFRRALGPLNIRVREKQFLTIPVDALSYGETVKTLRARGISVFRRKSYLATRHDGQFRVLFLLRYEVTLKHDPGLMPKPEEMAEQAKAGLLDLVKKILGEAA